MVNRPTHNARCCFTRRQIVAGLTVLPGALLLACNTSESTPTATPATTPASAGQAAAQPTSMPSPTAAPASVATPTAVPRRELRIGVQGLPPNLDPHQQLSNVGTRVTYSIFDYLIRRDFLSGPQPGTGFALVPWVA
jgi:ABC-type transport system substrate-binding protein